MKPNHKPLILWDWGTAYDLFASLHVLHEPEKFGLRGSWAAGVRSRLTAPQRSILEDGHKVFFSSPLAWVSRLPDPKDAGTALGSLSQIPRAEILPTLAFHADEPSEMIDALKDVYARRSWNEADLELLRHRYPPKEGTPHTDDLVSMLKWWSHPEEFGESYLAALQAYITVFFAEEERRIKPYLQEALAQAQALEKELDFAQLMVELSQGVKLAVLEQADEVLFVPSYWTTPLVMYDCAIDKHWVVLFGARPAEVALVPGEMVPDAMLRALKALSDPTRLLILRYLSEKPHTPAQLARKLRLRAPTVIHHLSALRLAGLLYVNMEAEGEKHYTVRETAVNDTFETMRKFLLLPGEDKH